MALGPFLTYVPPGIYTFTKADAPVTGLPSGIRIPMLIGVGQEELDQLDLELVRGSSASVDQQITREDVSQQFVLDDTNPDFPVFGPPDGVTAKFRVRNFPIVDGQGIGRTSNDVRSVSVTVNGESVAVAAVQGAKGYVTMQVPPQPTDDVRCTYYFHRGDTSFTDDVSSQVTATKASLTSPGYAPFDIVTGSSNTFIIKVNGTTYTVSLMAGTMTAAALKSQIDSALIPDLIVSVFTDNDNLDHLMFTATVSVEIGGGNANGPLGFTTGTQTNRNRDFRVFNIPVVDGTGGGITTTDTSKVVVKVNNIQVIPTAVDGKNGVVTLASAPAPGSIVAITYWANTWQDTFDYLPNTMVTGVIRCGIAPGRNDYIEGTDFVISNPSADVSIVHWGTSYTVASTTRTAGAEPFDESQIIPSLVDERFYLAECARVVDASTIPATVSTTKFTLPEVPTLGNGRDTPLGQSLYNTIANSRFGLSTNRPDLVTVRVGRNLLDALNRSAATVLSVDATSRVITLKDPVPPDYQAFATFWYNRVEDNSYIFTCKVPGPVGAGQYEVFDVLTQTNLYHIRFTGKNLLLTQTVQWPRGAEKVTDAFHASGTPVAEIVTVTFDQEPAKNAAYTNPGAETYSFYDPYSATWITSVNGVSTPTTLSTAVQGWLVGGHVTPIQTGPDAGKIDIPVGAILNLTIDGEAVAVALTSGAQTPAFIVGEINAAIDLVPAFAGTAPNNLAGFAQIGPATGDVLFYVQSYSIPAALPGGFDHVSYVRVEQGTAETVLGFATFQRADGTSGAINKPATVLGTVVGPFNITAGLNDNLKIRVDGTEYDITLPAGAAVTTLAVSAAINLVPGLAGVATVGTLANLDKLRLTSTTNTPTSSIVVLSGSANDLLGFTTNAFAGQTQVYVQEVVDALNSSVGFIAGAIAYASTIDGSKYLTIESLTVGAVASSIGFVSSANTAFNTTCGTGIVPGTSGDIGEDAHDKFDVTSNNALGSSGSGIPGQTYTDARTGLRFTVLPALTGSYATGGAFYLSVSPTFVVDPAVPYYSIPGLENLVSNTSNVGVNDTATVQTFNPSGVEPAVGDFYNISYRYLKQDFTARIFRQFKLIEANFGPASAENRVSLAAYLALINGAVLVGIKQVLKVVNTNQASDQAFIDALKELETPLPGNIRPDVMVPLATSPAVYSYLTQHCEVQSSVRNQNERIGFIGFASGTSPTSAQTIAKALNSNRIVAFYPDSAVITLTNELGEQYESLVDGSFFGAAVSGVVVSPAIDVATPYTHRTVQGFTRLPRIMDPVEANQTAIAGITILEDLDPIIRIRQGLTTNMASILTRLPTVTQIADYVQQQTRFVLDSFVGTKFLASRTNEVKVSMTAMFRQLVGAEIVGAFTGINAEIDTTDPTVMRAQAYYQPIFPLLYIVVQYNLRARI